MKKLHLHCSWIIRVCFGGIKRDGFYAHRFPNPWADVRERPLRNNDFGHVSSMSQILLDTDETEHAEKPGCFLWYSVSIRPSVYRNPTESQRTYIISA